MRLKAICWAFFAFTALVMLSWPSMVGMPPKGAPKQALKAYAVRAEIWLFVLVGSFMGTTISAALVVRQTRQEVLKESAENLKELIEGTLRDHKTKGETNDNSSR